VSFRKVEGRHVHYDDVHPGRMTPWLQRSDTYWRILGQLRKLHPAFFGDAPPAKPPDRVAGVSVVMSSYNQRRTLELALESFAGQKVLPVEVLVTDDGSCDGTLEWLDGEPDGRWPFPVRYVTRRHSWYRLASSNNKAARLTRGSRILFTNADQVHCPGSVAAHAALAANKLGAGVFRGVAGDFSKRVTLELVRDFSKVEALSASHPSGKTNAPHVGKVDPNANPIVVWGGNFSVPRDTFDKVGGYDEGYDVGWGGEENDLVARCIKAGTRAEWVPGSVIYHLDHPIRAYALSQLGSKRFLKR